MMAARHDTNPRCRGGAAVVSVLAAALTLTPPAPAAQLQAPAASAGRGACACSYRADPIDAEGRLLKPEPLERLEESFRLDPSDEMTQEALADAALELAERVIYTSCAAPEDRCELAVRLLGLVLELEPGRPEAERALRDLDRLYQTAPGPVLWHRGAARRSGQARAPDR